MSVSSVFRMMGIDQLLLQDQKSNGTALPHMKSSRTDSGSIQVSSESQFSKEQQAIVHDILQVYQDLNLQANADEIKKIVNTLHQYQKTGNVQIRAAILAARLGLPLDTSVLESITAVLGTGQGQQEMHQLWDWINQQIATSASDFSNPIFDAFSRLKNSFENPSRDNIAEAVKQMVDQLGLTRSFLRMFFGSDQETQQPVNSQGEFTHHPPQIHAAAKSLNTEIEHSVLVKVFNHLVGQQMLQGVRSEHSPVALFNFTIPFPLSDAQMGTVQVHLVSRKFSGNTRRLDPDYSTILFRLDLSALGATEVLVQVVERTVSLQISLDPEVDLKILPSERTQLQLALDRIGFRLGALKQENRSEESVSPFIFLMQAVQLQTSSFDLKV